MISELISQFKKYGRGGLIFAVAAIMLFSGLIVPGIAAAEHTTATSCLADIECGLVHAVIWILGLLGSLVGTVAGFFLTYLTALIQTLINAGTQLTRLDFVQKGFDLTLSLTNLGFVLAIIVIAFATILRMQNYAMKQLLWKLVVAALLVNFSFAIAGTIIDFTNVLGGYFLAGASPDGDPAKFGNNLADTFKIQQINQQPSAKAIQKTQEKSTLKTVWDYGKYLSPAYLFYEGGKSAASVAGGGPGSDAKKGLDAIISRLITLIVLIIFNTVLVITFAAVTFMLLIRLVYLAILLILMPVVWLFWIFPGLSKHWSDWWSKFIQWTFFYPAMMFFVFLSIRTPIGVIAGGDPTTSAADSFLLFGGNTVIYLEIAVKVAILFGGLMAAQKMGLTGASAFMNAAQGSARWIGSKAVRATGLPYAGRAAGRGAAGLGKWAAAPAAGKLANLLSRPGLRWIPGAKGAAAGLAGFASRKTEVEDYQKNFLAGLTPDQFKNVSLTSPVGPVAKAAILAEAIKRGKVADLTANMGETQTGARLELFSKAAGAANPALVKDLLAVNPRYADKFNKILEEVVKGIRADKASEINKDSLGDARVAMALSEAQLSNIYRSGSTEQKDNLRNALEGAAGFGGQLNAVKKQLKDDLENADKEIESLKKAISEAKEVGDKIKIKKSQDDLRIIRQHMQSNLLKQLSDDERKSYERLQSLSQRIANPNII